MDDTHTDSIPNRQSLCFEEAFSNFLDRREYDQAENALFAMIRIAFLAGWKAAGGESPKPQKVFQLLHKEISSLHNTNH